MGKRAHLAALNDTVEELLLLTREVEAWRAERQRFRSADRLRGVPLPAPPRVPSVLPPEPREQQPA